MTAPTNVRTCYRHPDRVAGISCQRCERPICPSCMHQASVGFHCPECARAGKQKVVQGPGAWAFQPVVTQVLIAVNVLAFIAMLATRSSDQWVYRHGFLWGPAVPDEPWRLVTGGFLHSNDIPFGFIHLGMNMYFIWILGQMMERALGRAPYLALYFAALAGGTLGVVLLDPEAPTVGASGAAYGLMGAAIVVARERNLDLMRSGLVTTLGINLLLTFSIPGISIGGHLGGLVAGGLAGLVLVEGRKRLGARGAALTTAATALMAVAFLLVAYVLMVGEYGDAIVRY